MAKLSRVTGGLFAFALISVASAADPKATPSAARVQPRPEMLLVAERPVQRHLDLSVERMSAVEAALAGAVQSRDTTVRPQGWPAGLSWRPLRHFGPFELPGFGRVQVRLNALAATWHYGDFLASHEDAAIFKKYYGATLPSGGPPAENHVPGTFLPSGGFNDVYLTLAAIRYSSRYGGSVAFEFRSREDFEVEIHWGSDLWDVKQLTMTVYVTPAASVFNPNAPPYTAPKGTVLVEFRAAGVTSYALVGAQDQIPVADERAAERLGPALRELSSAFSRSTGSWRLDPYRLAHGFVHSQFRDAIGTTDRVEMIALSDGFVDLRTREGQVTFLFDLMVAEVSLDTEPGSEEIHIAVAAEHEFSNIDPGFRPVTGYEWPEIDNHEGTYFVTLGAFRIEECPLLDAVIFLFRVWEEDPAGTHDYFQASAQQIGFDCANLEALAAGGTWGVVSQQTTPNLLLTQGGEVKGALSYVTRVRLQLW